MKSGRELDRCEQLGIVRGHNNQEYEQMTDEEITERVKESWENENHPKDTPGQRRERLIKFERTRNFMLRGGGVSLSAAIPLRDITVIFNVK